MKGKLSSLFETRKKEIAVEGWESEADLNLPNAPQQGGGGQGQQGEGGGQGSSGSMSEQQREERMNDMRQQSSGKQSSNNGQPEQNQSPQGRENTQMGESQREQKMDSMRKQSGQGQGQGQGQAQGQGQGQGQGQQWGRQQSQGQGQGQQQTSKSWENKKDSTSDFGENEKKVEKSSTRNESSFRPSMPTDPNQEKNREFRGEKRQEAGDVDIGNWRTDGTKIDYGAGERGFDRTYKRYTDESFRKHQGRYPTSDGYIPGARMNRFDDVDLTPGKSRFAPKEEGELKPKSWDHSRKDSKRYRPPSSNYDDMYDRYGYDPFHTGIEKGEKKAPTQYKPKHSLAHKKSVSRFRQDMHDDFCMSEDELHRQMDYSDDHDQIVQGKSFVKLSSDKIKEMLKNSETSKDALKQLEDWELELEEDVNSEAGITDKDATPSPRDEKLDYQMESWAGAYKKKSGQVTGGKGAIDYRSSADHLQLLDENMIIFMKVRDLIKKMLTEHDITRKIDGELSFWDRKIIRDALAFNHTRIPADKFTRPLENNIVFFVDVSGSVSHLANLFMSLIGGVLGMPGVRVVVGNESHATKELVSDKPFSSPNESLKFLENRISLYDGTQEGWFREDDRNFEQGIMEFLNHYNLFKTTTTCIFFGDLQGTNIVIPRVRKIIHKCQCLWLFTDSPGYRTYNNDHAKLVEAGMAIAYNVNNAKNFAYSVSRFQNIKPGLKICPNLLTENS